MDVWMVQLGAMGGMGAAGGTAAVRTTGPA